MDATQFSSLREKRFFHGNDITMTSQVGATYLKMCRHVLRIQWYLRCLSSPFCSDVIVAHKFTGVKRNFWLAKFLTSNHVRMHRVMFYMP